MLNEAVISARLCVAVEVLDLIEFAKSGFVCGLIIHEKSLQVTKQGDNSVFWRF